jgi:hypothetical protein
LRFQSVAISLLRELLSILLLLLLLFITFIQGVYNYMLEINHAFKVHNIAGIQLLQFTLQVMLFIELKDMLSYYYYYSLLLLMYAVCEGLLVRNTAFVFCRMTL